MMEKLGIIVLLMLLPMAMATTEGPKEVEEWFHDFNNTTTVTTQQKVTKLQFYFQDLRGVTTAMVAQSNTTAASPTLFGMLYAMDNPLTVGPSQTSKVIGRAQGLYGTTSHEEISITMAMNLVFTYGPYNGSSLTVLGSNSILHRTRELPVVGGSSLFRLARGVVMLKTYFFDRPRGNATVQFNVTVYRN